MDHDIALYIACGLGAIGVYLLVRHRDANYQIIGLLTGLAALAWLFVQLAATGEAGELRPQPLFYIFATIAGAAALRMITHPRPVYCALYFVMVVLSSAALFLLLGAEFMAFALIIVYAGAILITYLFVLMLAQQAPEESEESRIAFYDRQAREPAMAAFVGFLMIALLGQVIFTQHAKLPASPDLASRYADTVDALNLAPRRRAAFIEALHEDHLFTDLPVNARIRAMDAESIEFILDDTGGLRIVDLTQPDVDPKLVKDLMPTNIHRVGLALVHDFPASLELAGVILLMAMFGAVVLARKQIELSEDERREAAGLRRLTVEEPLSPDSPRDPEAGGGP